LHDQVIASLRFGAKRLDQLIADRRERPRRRERRRSRPVIGERLEVDSDPGIDVGQLIAAAAPERARELQPAAPIGRAGPALE
jgi:hypothetical protein